MVGQPEQLPVDDLGIVHIPREGVFMSDAAVRRAGSHAALITSPGQVRQVVAGGRSERATKHAPGQVRDIGDGAHTETVQLLLGARADAPQRPHRQRVQEGHDRIGGDQQHAIGLGMGAGDLRHELVGCPTHRAGDALLVEDPGTDEFGDGGGTAEPAQCPRDVEERLVE